MSSYLKGLCTINKVTKVDPFFCSIFCFGCLFSYEHHEVILLRGMLGYLRKHPELPTDSCSWKLEVGEQLAKNIVTFME